MLEFGKRILIVGYGAVAQCTLPVLLKHLKVPAKNITVMDFEDRRAQLAAYRKRGVKFVQQRIVAQNLAALLARHVGAGDLVIDLAWNIDCCEIVQWCHDHGVLYVNTSVEVWDPYEGAHDKHPTERTLYWRHMNIRRMVAGWQQPGPTAVLEHGANPGLISHFTKQGLLDIAKKALSQRKFTGAAAETIKQLAGNRVFNELAMRLGVKVIHCSETRRSPTSPRRSTSSSTPGASRASARRARRRSRWAGAVTRRNCRATPTSTRTGRRTRSASRAWASTPGWCRSCPTTPSTAWSSATAKRSASATG
jgi:homospermidine synthase